MSRFSTTASMTSSQRPKPLQSVVAVILASLRCISPRVMRRLSTRLFQIFDAAFSPPAIAFQLMSRMRTRASVLSAMICAMPPPITPAPRTPAAVTSTGVAAMRSFFDSSISRSAILKRSSSATPQMFS